MPYINFAQLIFFTPSIFIAFATLGFSLLSVLVHRPRAKKKSEQAIPKAPSSLFAAIPAYNESATIRRTLASIEPLQQFQAPRVYLRLDAPTDDTAEILASIGMPYHKNAINIGKWQTLERLIVEDIPAQMGDWILLLDAGTVIDEQSLKDIGQRTQQCGEDLAGIAPTYVNASSGFFSRNYWKLERWIKNIENLSGGPISIHGACICYRYRELRKVLRFIHLWRLLSKHPRLFCFLTLNDDVLIPVILQRMGYQIMYCSDIRAVDVSAPKSSQDTLAAYKRKLWGNLWIKVPSLYLYSPALFLKALRRISRIFIPHAIVLQLSLFALYHSIDTLLFFWGITTAIMLLTRHKSVAFSKQYLVLPLKFFCSSLEKIISAQVPWR